MVFASSISAERRANLRRLRAEFDAALAAMGSEVERGSAAYQVANARYRAWVAAIDDIAITLLDDVDAFEAASCGTAIEARSQPGRSGAADPIDVGRLFSDIDDLQRDANLIGSVPAVHKAARKSGPGSRAMSVVGHDRIARHWSRNHGHDCPVRLADYLL